MPKIVKIILSIMVILMIILDRNFLLIVVILLIGYHFFDLLEYALDVLENILSELKKINKWNKHCTKK